MKLFRYQGRMVKVVDGKVAAVGPAGSGGGLQRAPRQVRDQLVAAGWNPQRESSDVGRTVPQHPTKES